ncbi:MAG: FAD-binding oxidoreductase [Nanoarchaeota archaeon]
MKVVVKEMRTFAEGNFLLKAKPEGRLDYEAGQFVMIKIDEIAKPFSIASPVGSETIDFLISVHPDGEITPRLAKLKRGDGFEIEGPYGAFTVKDTNAKEIIFIAAGTGVSPFRAMVVDALKRFSEKKISLIFGFRYDYYFEKEWKDLEKEYKNLKICACCSRPAKSWKGLKGRVTDHLGEIAKEAKGKEVYVCGPPAMVGSTKEVLRKIGFKDKQVHTEKW